MCFLKTSSYLKFIVLLATIIYPLPIFCNDTEDKKNTYFVIVNSDNSYMNESEKGFRKIGLIYKGNSKEWPGKIKATFFSRDKENPAQISFYDKILKMKSDEVQSYWDRKLENGIYRPRVIKDVRKLVNEISKNEGSVSIVSSSELEKIPAKIKVLYEY